jgi:zinc finger protein CreA/MIG
MMQHINSLIVVLQGASSYARPTAVSPARHSSQARRSVHSQPSHPPSPNAFTTLSSVALDELHALEKQEAIRRAEYEARRAEALRRAEYEAHRGGRRVKSATTSPVTSASPLKKWSRPDDGSSSKHARHFGPSWDEDSDRAKALRRLSGPAWHLAPVSRDPAEPPTHAVNLVNAPTSVRAQMPGRDAYHLSHKPRFRHRVSQDAHDDSASSSDSDSIPAAGLTVSPVHSFLTPHSGLEGFPTPSTSPFLGPLRTLNLHSAHPSRAPSPIMLPPSIIQGEDSNQALDEGFHSHGRKKGLNATPYNGTLDARPPSKHTDGVVRNGHLPFPATSAAHLHERSLTSLHTPQLSSGPSSVGSSPGSIPYRTLLPSAPSVPPFGSNASDTPNGSRSRPSSPPRRYHPLHHRREHSHGDKPLPHHHHLVHSVRKAFGMTPIHTSCPRPQPVNHLHSLPALSSRGARGGQASSVPVSRSSSPPIVLPPLRLAAKRRPSGSQSSGDEADVELPHFSEFAAAALAPHRTTRMDVEERDLRSLVEQQ